MVQKYVGRVCPSHRHAEQEPQEKGNSFPAKLRVDLLRSYLNNTHKSTSQIAHAIDSPLSHYKELAFHS